MFDRFHAAGWEHPWWHGFMGWFLPLLFLLVIAALVAWALMRATGERRPAPAGPWPPATPGDSALNEVRLRYARGELPRDEFLRISTDLEGSLPERGAGPNTRGGEEPPGDPPSSQEEEEG